MKRKGQDMFNKLTKTKIILGSKRLRPYIPTTQKMNVDTLRAMLQNEKMVYIKPCRGAQGRGVMRLEVDRRNIYHYQYGVKKRRFSSFKRMYRSILEEIGNKPYLVQKGIRLLTYKGLIFDIRVMVQHNSRRRWEVTGMAGRVAHPRKVVTNGSQGGAIYPVETLLQPYLKKGKKQAVLAKLRKIGLQSAETLTRGYSNKHEIGVDIALDRRLKPWVLEVNWNPDPCPFTKLKDRSMLNKILRYAKIYGKTYKLNCTKAKQGR